MMAPVGVVGQAVGAALLPSLTALHQREDAPGFDRLLTTTLRTTLGLGLLAAGALAALALPLVRLIYAHGRFSEADGELVAGLLRILAIAVPGWVVQQVAVRGFYARGEMWLAMGLSTAIALGVFPLYWLGGAARGIEGLAMASATAISLNAVLTIVWLRVRTGSPDPIGLLTTLTRGALVVSVAGIATLFSRPVLQAALPGISNWPIVALVGGGAVYGGVALLAARLFGDEPMRAGLDALSKRLLGMLPRRRRPASPSDPDDASR
jgi:putative peptidoglycan lipid II flippase